MFFILLLFQGLGVVAQAFSMQAPLPLVTASGFYQIPVLPDLSVHAKNDLSDLRIRNDKKEQIPFIVRLSSELFSPESFIDFPILSNVRDSTITTLQIESKKAGIKGLSLFMGNSAVERYTAISGSYDRHHWFIIDDRILLSNTGHEENGHFIQSLSFPYNRYTYYKLIINNAGTDPINILKAGIYSVTEQSSSERWISNPQSSIHQKDSINGDSYVTILNKAPYLTQRFRIDVQGPKFYNRAVQLYSLKRDGTRSYTAGFTLRSGLPSTVTFSGIKAATFLMVIRNGDNPPLQIRAVHTEQLQRYLIAYLEKEKPYFLLAGNIQASSPNYDLAQFKDSIPASLPLLNYGTLRATNSTNDLKIKSRNDWLWPAIILAVLLLTYLTYSLIKDMKQSGM